MYILFHLHLLKYHTYLHAMLTNQSQATNRTQQETLISYNNANSSCL